MFLSFSIASLLLLASNFLFRSSPTRLCFFLPSLPQSSCLAIVYTSHFILQTSTQIYFNPQQLDSESRSLLLGRCCCWAVSRYLNFILMFVPSINFYNPFINLIKTKRTQNRLAAVVVSTHSPAFFTPPSFEMFIAPRNVWKRDSGSNSCLRRHQWKWIATYLLWNFLPQIRQTFAGVESVLWTFLTWFKRFALRVKLIGQPSRGHSKIRSFVCWRRCARSDSRLKNFLHTWHSIFNLLS